MATLPISPFIFDPDRRFILDERKFFEDIIVGYLDLEAAPPSFLSAPRPEYLKATEIAPLLKTVFA
jgi:hypothetical protein